MASDGQPQSPAPPVHHDRQEAVRQDGGGQMTPSLAPGVVRDVLELARWAPSGDNTQCWRFELVDERRFVVHGFDTREHCVYDLDGHPSQISIGALLETANIAASAHGMRAEAVRRPDGAPDRPTFDVRLVDAGIVPSPLIAAITRRTVQRRAMQTRPLTSTEKQAMEQAVGPGYSIDWLEGFGTKLNVARLMYDNAKLRLSMPEAYATHRKVIHWGVTHSPDRVPDQALGVDKATLKLMKWAMHSWSRLSRMNLVMGNWAPRLQMDLLLGLACAAHFVLKANQAPASIDDYIDAGAALTRLWLTMTHLGLYMQPEMTPLIFSKYVRENRHFTATRQLHGPAARLREQTEKMLFAGSGFPVYMGRVGAGKAPRARSERRPLDELLQS